MTTEHTPPSHELRPGVPDDLLAPLTAWLEQRLATSTSTEPYSRSLLQAIEASFGRPLAWDNGDTHAAYESLRAHLRNDRGLCLDVIDLVLSRLTADDRAAIDDLERILNEADSAWTVSTVIPPGLERRLGPPVDALAREMFESHTTAGDELRRAWRYAWGRRPNASVAYRSLLRAVEDALGPVIAPGNTSPSMVGLITALRDNLDHFEVRTGGDETIPDVATVLTSLESLQQGIDGGRAAGYPYDPLTVSVPQTQSAVVLALRLIHLAQSGAFARRS